LYHLLIFSATKIGEKGWKKGINMNHESRIKNHEYRVLLSFRAEPLTWKALDLLKLFLLHF